VNPETAETLAGPVNALLQDKALVRRARVAAVERGDLPAIALDEDDGTRSIYTGANKVAAEDLPMVARTLASSGALDTSDFAKLTSKQRAIFGGKATVQDEERAVLFANTLAELSKVDSEINDIVAAAASAEGKEEAMAREGFGARAGAFAVGSLAAPFAAIGEITSEALGNRKPPTQAEVLEYGIRAGDNTPAELIAERLKANPLLRKRFSEEEIDKFTRDEVLRGTNYKFDSSKPESGIRELSTGEVLIAPALLAKPALFEDSLNKTQLNEDQKTWAREERAELLDARAPEMLKLLTDVDDDAASAFAQAKAQGKSDREFLETWMSDEKNYSAFNNRMASVGGKARAAVTDIFVGLGALMGSEAATKFALEDRARLNKRAEFAALFGDDFGIGQQALEALPQVAVDMALTFGTAGAGRAVTAAGSAALNSSKALAKFGIATLDDTALAAVRAATATGGEAAASAALREVGRNWVTRAAGNAAERVLPVALPAFTRSATSTYVSIYGNLPDDMTHEEKHKQAFGYSLAAGFATAAITAGMSSLGLGGTESLALGAAGRKGLSELTFREAKLVYEAVKNEGRAVSKDGFQSALAAETMGAYRNLASMAGKGFMGEAFEEALDQSINIALDDAASKKNTPLAEKLEQVWNAGLIGGILGGGISLASQALPVSKSAQTRALEQRTSVLDGIAKRLSTSGAPETASTVQRMMDAANAQLNQSKKKDAANAAAQTAAAPKTAVRTVAEQTEFKFDDPRGVPPANTRLFELVGERVYVDGTNINGIAELDTDTGEIVINFSTPTKVKGKPNVTRFVIGNSKYQKATGLSLRPKVKTLSKPVGTLPAGTRTFSNGKYEYVLPSTEAVNKARAEGKPLLLLVRDENQRVVGVTVRGAALVKSPPTRTDTTITDPELIREVLRLYPEPAAGAPVGIAPFRTPTEEAAGITPALVFNDPNQPQLDLTFGGAAQAEFGFVGNLRPAPAATDTEDQADLAALGDSDEIQLTFRDSPDYDEVRASVELIVAQISEDPVLKALHATGIDQQGFSTLALSFTPEQITEAGAALDLANESAEALLDDPEALSSLVRNTQNQFLFVQLNKTLDPLRVKYDRTIQIRRNTDRRAGRTEKRAAAASRNQQAAARGRQRAAARRAAAAQPVGRAQGPRDTGRPANAAVPDRTAEDVNALVELVSGDPVLRALHATPDSGMRGLLGSFDEATLSEAQDTLAAADELVEQQRSIDQRLAQRMAAPLAPLKDKLSRLVADRARFGASGQAEFGFMDSVAQNTVAPDEVATQAEQSSGTSLQESFMDALFAPPPAPAPKPAAKKAARKRATPAPTPTQFMARAQNRAVDDVMQAGENSLFRWATELPVIEGFVPQAHGTEINRAIDVVLNGIGSDRTFFTGPLVGRETADTGAGVRTYGQAQVALVGKGNNKIASVSDIDYVVVNDNVAPDIELLRAQYPQVEWLTIPEADARYRATQPVVPAPKPAAKKAAKKAPTERAKVTKEFIDKSLAAAVKLRTLLENAGTRDDKLNNRPTYRDTIQTLDVFGFKLADLPPEFLAQVNAVQDNPADIDRLFAMLLWADSTLNPTPTPAPEPTVEAEPITAEEIEDWLDGNAETLVGGTLRGKDGSDVQIVAVERNVDSGELEFTTDDKSTQTVPFDRDQLLRAINPESFRPYLESVTAEPVAEPAAVEPVGKPTLVSKNKNETTYRYGRWLITTTKKSESTFAGGLRKTTNWTVWNAIDMVTNDPNDMREGTGGIVAAQKELDKVVSPEPVAGTGVESEFGRARNAAEKMRDLLKVELKTDYPRLSELALEPKAKRTKVLAKIRELLLESRVSPFSQGFFLYGTEEVERQLSVTKQLYDEATPDESIKKQKAEVLKRIREKVERAIVEARTDEQTARARKIVEEQIGKKVTSYGSLTPANLVLFGPSGYGFVNLDKEAQELRGLDPNRSKKYFADRLAKAEDFNSEWRTFTLDVSKEVDELTSEAFETATEAAPKGIDRKKLEKFIETVDDAQMNLASAARIKTLAKKALDAGSIEQRDHDEAVREANDKGLDPGDRAAAAVDTLLRSLQFFSESLDTRNRMLGAGTRASGFLPGEPVGRVGSFKRDGALGEADRAIAIAIARVRNRGKDPAVELRSALVNTTNSLGQEGLQLDEDGRSAFDGAIVELDGGAEFESVLARLMESLGYEKVGNIGGRVPMDTIVYDDLEGGMLPGDPARVETHGYRFPGQDSRAVVVKSGVRPLPLGTPIQMLAPAGTQGLAQPITDFNAALREMLPAGFTLQADPNMDGALGYDGVGSPSVVYYNPNQVGAITEGLALADARATLRTAVDHELSHAAADAVYTPDDYQALADELGTEMLATIVDTYYMGAEPDFDQRAARIAADRASGAMPDWKIAAEWVRMEQERIVFGRTSEQRMLFLRTRPSLLAKFIESLEAFVVRLRARFFEAPTTGTAASISRAARQLRKLKNGGWLPAPPAPDPNGLGHAAEIYGALERGSDQTLFMLPLAAAAGLDTQVEGLWSRIKKKFVNLPPELKNFADDRDSTQRVAGDAMLSFQKRMDRMLPKAVAEGVDPQDIGLMLGRTAPTLDDAANARIQAAVDTFTSKFPADALYDPTEEAIRNERARLRGIEVIKSNTAFRTQQQDAEQRIRDAGHPKLADAVKGFRDQIDSYSGEIGHLHAAISENLQVYLKRTYSFFTTEGWALMAQGKVAPDGTQLAMYRGSEVDFQKLRANAAALYEQQAIAEAAKAGTVLSADELAERTHELLDKYLERLQKGSNSDSGYEGESLKQDLDRFMKKGDHPKAIRELLGEIQDPLENALRTMHSVAKIAANDKFMRDTRQWLLADPTIGSTRPAKGLVPALGGRTPNPALMPLADVYTTPEIASALQAEFGSDGRNFERNTNSTLKQAGRALMKTSSFAVTMKTLPSIGFHSRNMVGGQVGLLGAQGILFANRYFKESYSLSFRANFESFARTPEQEAKIARLIELSVMKDDTTGRVFADMMRGFVTDSGQDLDSLLDVFNDANAGNPKRLMELIGSKTKGGYNKTIEVLAAWNNMVDSAVKTQTYFYELDVLKRAYAKELAADPSRISALEVEAADKAKATMPTHSQQYAIVKSLGQSPAGLFVFPFARWKTEIVRTMINTPKLAYKEIKTGNPVLIRRGIQRMIGFSTVTVALGSILGEAFSFFFNLLAGDDEEEGRKLTPEETYALRAALPNWQKGHALHTRLSKGEVQVIDMTAIAPYAMMTDLVSMSIEGAQTGEGIQPRRMASYVVNQMIGTQIAANVALEVLGNENAFGQPIYRETDNAAEVFGKSFVHFAKGALEPPISAKFRAFTREGEKDPWEIVVGEFLGARPQKHSLAEVEYRAFRSVKQLLDDSAQIKSKLVTGRALEPNEVTDTLIEHQDALNKTQRQLAKVMSGLQSMGSTRGAVYRSADTAGFSKQRLSYAERGENLRWVPNTQWRRSMFNNVTRTGEQDPMERDRLILRTLGEFEPIQDVFGDQ
jgi:hypothetical protein